MHVIHLVLHVIFTHCIKCKTEDNNNAKEVGVSGVYQFRLNRDVPSI